MRWKMRIQNEFVEMPTTSNSKLWFRYTFVSSHFTRKTHCHSSQYSVQWIAKDFISFAAPFSWLTRKEKKKEMMEKKLFLFWDGWSVENEVKSTFQPNSSFNSFNLKLKSIHSRAAAADDGALNEDASEGEKGGAELRLFFLIPILSLIFILLTCHSQLRERFERFIFVFSTIFIVCRTRLGVLHVSGEWRWLGAGGEREKKCWKMWRDWLFKHELWNENVAKWSMGGKVHSHFVYRWESEAHQSECEGSICVNGKDSLLVWTGSAAAVVIASSHVDPRHCSRFNVIALHVINFRFTLLHRRHVTDWQRVLWQRRIYWLNAFMLTNWWWVCASFDNDLLEWIWAFLSPSKCEAKESESLDG